MKKKIKGKIVKRTTVAPEPLQPLGWDRVINERYDPAVPITDIRPHPKNPRAGDIGAISQSIAHNGFYGACVVQQSTGYILVGNHRHQAAAHEGAATLPVIWVNVDDETARRILVSDNRSNDLSSYNHQALAELLASIQSEQGDLTGTLYDQEDYDRLLSDLANGYVSGLSPDELKSQQFAGPNATVNGRPAPDSPEENWKGMPEFHQDDLSPWQTLKVHFREQADREAFARLVGQDLTEHTLSIWHPKAETAHNLDKRYVGTSAE
jgi:ParB-like nuclease domain